MAEPYDGYSILIGSIASEFSADVGLCHTGGGCMAILAENLRDHPGVEILITDAEDTLSQWDGTSPRFTGYAVGVYDASAGGYSGEPLAYLSDKHAIASTALVMIHQALEESGR